MSKLIQTMTAFVASIIIFAGISVTTLAYYQAHNPQKAPQSLVITQPTYAAKASQQTITGTVNGQQKTYDVYNNAYPSLNHHDNAVVYVLSDSRIDQNQSLVFNTKSDAQSYGRKQLNAYITKKHQKLMNNVFVVLLILDVFVIAYLLFRKVQ